jgi:hypothetical protein
MVTRQPENGGCWRGKGKVVHCVHILLQASSFGCHIEHRNSTHVLSLAGEVYANRRNGSSKTKTVNAG